MEMLMSKNAFIKYLCIYFCPTTTDVSIAGNNPMAMASYTQSLCDMQLDVKTWLARNIFNTASFSWALSITEKLSTHFEYILFSVLFHSPLEQLCSCWL
jgi:hypothetical protein